MFPFKEAFLTFSFSILIKKKQISFEKINLPSGLLLWEERSPNLFPLVSKWSPCDKVESLTSKKNLFLWYQNWMF